MISSRSEDDRKEFKEETGTLGHPEFAGTGPKRQNWMEILGVERIVVGTV